MSGAFRFKVGDVVMVSADVSLELGDALRRSKAPVARGVVEERCSAPEGRRYPSYTVVFDPPVGKLRTTRVSERGIVGLAAEYAVPTHEFFTVITSGPLFFLRVPKPIPKWRDFLKGVGALVRPYGVRIRDVQLEGRDGTESKDEADLVRKLQKAFSGDTSVLAKFGLADWSREGPVVVRPYPPA